MSVVRTKLVRDRLMEEKFAQYIEAKFPSDGKRGLVESYMLLMQTKIKTITRI